MRVLTEEQLAKVDEIIRSTEIESSWVWDGECSLKEESAAETLVSAARRVREYLAGLGEG